MKRCPSCDRTYADETLSFCLVDGAVLSAPYDAQATDPPATEILPPATNPAPTQRAQESWPVNSTLQSPGYSNRVRPDNFQAEPAMLKKSRLPLLIGGLVVLAAISIVFIIGFNMGSEKAERSNGNSSIVNPSRNTNSENSNPLTQPAPIPESVNASNVNQGNSGIGTGSGTGVNGNTAPSSEAGATPVDGSKIFRPSEVDQKARILSKPAPEYTVEARQNQVAGTVVLQVILSSSGTVDNIKAVSGLPYGLTEKAIAAARKIRFTPAMKDGRAVSQHVKIEYNFNIY